MQSSIMEVTDPRQDLPPPPIHEQQPQEIPQEPQQQQFIMPQQWEYQQPVPRQPELSTFEISKQTWVMISVVFALGLFMGKSLQPIIVRST